MIKSNVLLKNFFGYPSKPSFKTFDQKKDHLSFYDVIQEDDLMEFIDNEQSNLKKMHRSRNDAQHRGYIVDSLHAQQYMEWSCKFLKRFAKDNFKENLTAELSPELKRIWSKLTYESSAKASFVSFELKQPLDENYKRVENWIRFREQNSKRGILGKNYKNGLLYHLGRYCKYMETDPELLIENTHKGILFPDRNLTNFIKDKRIHTPQPYWVTIRSYYDFNGIALHRSIPKYQSRRRPVEISTEELRKICDVADIETRSWILANSYMGLQTGEICLLQVKDFHPEAWNKLREIYPVKIREEVSGTHDFTTFIGLDAMKVLKKYFTQKGFKPEANPWDYDHIKLNYSFKKYAIKANIRNKLKGHNFLTPKSLINRLRKKLDEAGMQHNWILYLSGRKYEGNSPLDQEIEKAYLKAFPSLRITDN